MKKRIFISLAGMTLLGLAAWLANKPATPSAAQSAAQSAGYAANKARTQGPILVSIASAQRMTVPVRLEASGYVSALHTVEVRPQVSNVIEKVHIREGQFVKAGDVLFSLDGRASRANLQRTEAQLAKDQATLADLERQLARSRELLAKNFIAQSATDTVQSQVEAQRASVQASRAAVEAAKVALGYETIRASLSGRAGAIAVFPGSLVQPASAPLVTVAQLDPIGISFTLPETELSALLAAQKNGAVKVAAHNGDGKTPLEGTLSFVDNAVDAQSGTIRVKAVFPNAEQRLWPGQYVTVSTVVRELLDAVVIPQAAIITGTDSSSVYVMDGDKAQQRSVKLMHAFGAQAAVSGVQPGDKVVVDGKHNLRTGSLVREIRSPSEPQAPSATPTSKPERAPVQANRA